MGKGKIKIARIEDRRKRRACFSKRCTGLFKKASELKTLSRSDVAVVVFYCDDKPYVFGSPSGAKNVFRRFLTKVGDSPPAADQQMTPDSAVSKLVLQLEDEEGYVVEEEKKTQLGEIGERVEIEDMDDLDELEELQKRLNERRGVLLAQGKHQQACPLEPAMFDQVNNFYCGQETFGPVCDDAATVFCNTDNPMQAMAEYGHPIASNTPHVFDYEVTENNGTDCDEHDLQLSNIPKEQIVFGDDSCRPSSSSSRFSGSVPQQDGEESDKVKYK